MNVIPGDFIRTRDGRDWRVCEVEWCGTQGDCLLHLEGGDDKWTSTWASWHGRTWWFLRE